MEKFERTVFKLIKDYPDIELKCREERVKHIERINGITFDHESMYVGGTLGILGSFRLGGLYAVPLGIVFGAFTFGLWNNAIKLWKANRLYRITLKKFCEPIINNMKTILISCPDQKEYCESIIRVYEWLDVNYYLDITVESLNEDSEGYRARHKEIEKRYRDDRLRDEMFRINSQNVLTYVTRKN